MKLAAVNLEQALLDPSSMFESPEDIAAHAGLTREQKIEILRLWQYDASEAEVATEEGMPGGDGELLRRILLALDSLIGEVDVGNSGPTKQQAVLARRPRRT